MLNTVKCCNLINVTRAALYGDAKFFGVKLKYENMSKRDGFLEFSVYCCDDDSPQ
jgi:hypothetical protein